MCDIYTTKINNQNKVDKNINTRRSIHYYAVKI